MNPELHEFIKPLLLSLQLAVSVSVSLVIIMLPVAYGIYWSQKMLVFHWRQKLIKRAFLVLETVCWLPLILPPTVLGLYFLMWTGQQSTLGQWLNQFDFTIPFTFFGMWLALFIFSIPFALQPMLLGFRQCPDEWKELLQLMPISHRKRLLKFFLPHLKVPLLMAFILSFSHVLGEFGVVLMVGGGIPDRSETVSIAIFRAFEQMEWSRANHYSLILLIFSCSVLLWMQTLSRRHQSTQRKL